MRINKSPLHLKKKKRTTYITISKKKTNQEKAT